MLDNIRIHYRERASALDFKTPPPGFGHSDVVFELSI